MEKRSESQKKISLDVNRWHSLAQNRLSDIWWKAGRHAREEESSVIYMNARKTKIGVV